MKTISEIQDEHTVWVVRNFGSNRGLRHPAMGMVEEVGELFHAVLKSEQGIRGTKQKHDAAARDAVGDVCLYAVDYATKLGVRVADELGSESFDVRVRLIDPLLSALRAATEAYEAVTVRSDEQRKMIGADAIFNIILAMSVFCATRGWSLHDIVNETWDHVSKRDWTRNPVDGA